MKSWTTLDYVVKRWIENCSEAPCYQGVGRWLSPHAKALYRDWYNNNQDYIFPEKTVTLPDWMKNTRIYLPPEPIKGEDFEALLTNENFQYLRKIEKKLKESLVEEIGAGFWVFVSPAEQERLYKEIDAISYQMLREQERE